MERYTYYWRDGSREVLEGTDFINAFTRAGYSSGAVRALDFFMEGDDKEYEWDSECHTWKKVMGR